MRGAVIPALIFLLHFLHQGKKWKENKKRFEKTLLLVYLPKAVDSGPSLRSGWQGKRSVDGREKWVDGRKKSVDDKERVWNMKMTE